MADEVPGWVVAIGASVPVLIGAGYAMFKFVQKVRIGNRAYDREGRRDAVAEAWELLDALEAKMAAAEERERQCQQARTTELAEKAKILTVLRILVAWARKQKNPPPIPDDLLQLADSGSGQHTPVQ